jgi:hypothetical protein
MKFEKKAATHQKTEILQQPGQRTKGKRDDLCNDILVEKTNQMSLKQRSDTSTAETEPTILSPNSKSSLYSRSECSKSPNEGLEILSSSDEEDYFIWYANSLSDDEDNGSREVFLFPEDDDMEAFQFARTSSENFLFHNLSDAAAVRKEFFLCHVPASIAEEASFASGTSI